MKVYKAAFFWYLQKQKTFEYLAEGLCNQDLTGELLVQIDCEQIKYYAQINTINNSNIEFRYKWLEEILSLYQYRLYWVSQYTQFHTVFWNIFSFIALTVMGDSKFQHIFPTCISIGHLCCYLPLVSPPFSIDIGWWLCNQCGYFPC